MNWTAPVDIYCERVGPEFWAEPANAISNLAFILAALWAWRTATVLHVKSRAVTALTVLAFCIGVGSFLFHTFANTWSGLADVVPIWTFVAVYVLTCIHVVGGVPPGRIAIGVGVLIALIAVLVLSVEAPEATTPPETSWLNGSEQYAPAVLAMLFFSGLTLYRRHPLRYWFVTATLTFLVSLTFRTLDVHVCASLPIGTHFLWHMLNGAMIALLLQALIRHHAHET